MQEAAMLGLRVRKGTVRFGRDGQSAMKRKAVVWSHDLAKIVCRYMYMFMSVCAYSIYIYLCEWRIAIRRGILSQSGNCW